MIAALLVLQLAAASDCTDADVATLQQAERLLARGDDRAAGELIDSQATESRCALIAVARLASTGWSGARAAAPKGGAPEFLDAVRQTLVELQAFKSADVGLEAEYADVAVRAAIAAAQDERPEMELLLVHARDLAERLQLRGRRALWPRPFNLLAGELWFEVDRYEEARLSYARAAEADPSAAALVGLARAYARLNHPAAACATFRRVKDIAPALRAAAAGDLSRCR